MPARLEGGDAAGMAALHVGDVLQLTAADVSSAGIVAAAGQQET